ncbi:hypothetical protein M501DRAFT_934936, partial [Patellaria atrata CBS 101060]
TMLDTILSLPLLSFFALPALSSWSTSLNLLFFYMTWSTLVLSHPPLRVEIYGTLFIRVLFYLVPSLLFLALDTLIPSLAATLKAQEDYALPGRLGRKKLMRVVGWSIFNVLMGVAIQTGLELFVTQVLQWRSVLKVTTTLPVPWGIFKDLVKGFIVRGTLQYYLHRYILHGSSSQVARLHQSWQHSIRVPFALVANYDHPLPWLLQHYVPLYMPALLFRFHILTFQLMLALVSLEEAFTYSGYAVLPSTIMLSGMARRRDRHFMSQGKGNYGAVGVLDWVCGTTTGDDVMDDVMEEMDKHNVQERAGRAVEGAGDAINNATDRWGGRNRKGRGRK